MNEHPFSYSESENAPVAPGLERRIRVRMAEAQEAARINRADADSGWCLNPNELRRVAHLHEVLAEALREVLEGEF